MNHRLTKTTSDAVTASLDTATHQSTAVMPTENHIVLCPGQGAQHVGMGKTWHERSVAAQTIFAAADDALGFKLSQICFEGPEATLNRTQIAQAAIYTTSVACFEGLKQQGRLDRLGAIAGLSLGEFTALHLSGAFDFVTGLRLVHLRGRAMQEAADAVQSGMVALVGADEKQADVLCRETLKAMGQDTDQSVLVPANYNCPGQVVISGSQAACQRALELAHQMGLRATPLKVAGAFHSPLMQPAAHRLARALDEVAWKTPRVTVVSNVTALPHAANDITLIKTRLVDQLTQPVRWTRSMQWLVRNTSGRYVELAPGKVLSGLMRRIDRTTKVQNFSEPLDLQSDCEKS